MRTQCGLECIGNASSDTVSGEAVLGGPTCHGWDASHLPGERQADLGSAAVSRRHCREDDGRPSSFPRGHSRGHSMIASPTTRNWSACSFEHLMANSYSAANHLSHPFALIKPAYSGGRGCRAGLLLAGTHA